MIALVTAFPMELAPLTKGWRQKYISGRYTVYYSTINSVSVYVLVTGMGFEHAKNAVTSFIQKHSMKYIIATGYAGGLDSKISHGDLIVANKILGFNSTSMNNSLYSKEELFHNLKNSNVKNLTIHNGPLISSTQIISETNQKQEFSSLGIALDMESFAVAQVAEGNGIPWGAVRVITDIWNETLPFDFSKHQSSNGQINYIKVILSTIKQPSKIKNLLRLGKYSKLATQNLTNYWQNIIPKLPA